MKGTRALRAESSQLLQAHLYLVISHPSFFFFCRPSPSFSGEECVRPTRGQASGKGGTGDEGKKEVWTKCRLSGPYLVPTERPIRGTKSAAAPVLAGDDAKSGVGKGTMTSNRADDFLTVREHVAIRYKLACAVPCVHTTVFWRRDGSSRAQRALP